MSIERLGNPATPLPIVNALFHTAVESGVRPVARASTELCLMFDRVVGGVIEMPSIIPFIPQRMFPGSPLPYPAPPVVRAGCGSWLFRPNQGQPALGEMVFDALQRSEQSMSLSGKVQMAWR